MEIGVWRVSRGGVSALFIAGWVLGVPQSATANPVQTLQFKTKSRTLTFEVLNDHVFHFEYASPSSATTHAIPTTPFVAKTQYAGPAQFNVSGNSFATKSGQFEIDPSTLCFTVTDSARHQTLTRACPTDVARSAQTTGMTLDQLQMQDVYGLGEQFLTPGEPNGDWIGKMRTPGGKYGNAMTVFAGGVTGNAQFPVFYAVGPSSLNYAFYLDTVYPLSWNFTSKTWKVTRTLEGTDPAFRGYVILGENLPSLRESFMDLVGHPLVPPKKAFGLWVSQFGYHNWGEVQDKLTTLRFNRFPVDGFVLDLYWFGGFQSDSADSRMGFLDWDTANFANPAQTIADFASDGIGLMTIEESYVSQGLANFESMASRGFLARQKSGSPWVGSGWWGKGGMVDWTSPAAGAAWHDEHRKKLTDAGITFHWTDLGEPEQYDQNNVYDGGYGTGHLHADVHNLYNFLWHKSIYDGYERNHVERRHFILSRSGGPGLQRFGSAMWSGDIGSNLRSLSAHLDAQMHMSMSGIDYFGADIGGFHGESLEGDRNEVYTRWFAYASLFDVPVRPHTDDGNRYNTAPDRIGDMKSNLFNIRQRYELAPYYYSLAYRAWLNGEPVFPPLVYYYQNDPNVRIIAEEKMIGPDLLAATAEKIGENNRGVYLPAGDWVDYHTGQWFHSQGQWFADFSLTDDYGVFRLPLFARAGAIIPKMPVDGDTMNILGMRSDGSTESGLTVRVVPSRTPTQFTLFEDDGVTEAYRRSGAYATTLIEQHLTDEAEFITIHPRLGTYDGAPAERVFRAEVSIEGKEVWRALRNGRPLQFFQDPSELDSAYEGWTISGGLVVIKTDWASATDETDFEFDLR